MPHKTGRTGEPGNSTTYHPIHIQTPHPEKLMGVKRQEAGKHSGKVPGRSHTFERKGNKRGY